MGMRSERCGAMLRAPGGNNAWEWVGIDGNPISEACRVLSFWRVVGLRPLSGFGCRVSETPLWTCPRLNTHVKDDNQESTGTTDKPRRIANHTSLSSRSGRNVGRGGLCENNRGSSQTGTAAQTGDGTDPASDQ